MRSRYLPFVRHPTSILPATEQARVKARRLVGHGGCEPRVPDPVRERQLTSSRAGTLTRMPYRRWTRLGIVAVAGHLGYELAVGAGVPGAPRLGLRPALAGYALGTAGAYRAAGRLPGPRGDRRFAVANGLFASAVISHYASWPRTAWHGLPWLVECEGIEGALIAPYNMVLQVSAVAAVGGLGENLSAWRWAVAAGLIAVPALRWLTPREYDRLLEQAAAQPRWWNRRLAVRVRSSA